MKFYYEMKTESYTFLTKIYWRNCQNKQKPLRMEQVLKMVGCMSVSRYVSTAWNGFLLLYWHGKQLMTSKEIKKKKYPKCVFHAIQSFWKKRFLWNQNCRALFIVLFLNVTDINDDNAKFQGKLLYSLRTHTQKSNSTEV